MADGSVRQAVQDQAYIGTIPVLVGEDHLVDFGVASQMWNPEEMGQLASRLIRIATATLRVALTRGDNPADYPGTFGEAVEGAHVLLQMSMGIQDSANKLSEQEKARG